MKTFFVNIDGWLLQKINPDATFKNKLFKLKMLHNCISE